MKLNLGCGHDYREGWINIDGPQKDLCYPDLKADRYVRIEDLHYPDNSIDEILMSAVFEHFPRHVAIMQLRKFYKWLTPGGRLTVLVPDFWGTIKMLKKSKSPAEQQFWFRHLYGPQDTDQFGTHFDGFDIPKLKLMFSTVGFTTYEHMMIKNGVNIRFTGIKDAKIKSDIDVERDIVAYMANFEIKEESGLLFNVWMNAMGLKAKKPETIAFRTHTQNKRLTVIDKIYQKVYRYFICR